MPPALAVNHRLLAKGWVHPKKCSHLQNPPALCRGFKKYTLTDTSYEFILRRFLGRSQESPVSTAQTLPESVSFVSTVGSWTFGASESRKGSKIYRKKTPLKLWLVHLPPSNPALMFAHQPSIRYLNINQPLGFLTITQCFSLTNH